MKHVILMVYFNLTLGIRLNRHQTNDPQKPIDLDSGPVNSLFPCDPDDEYDCANLDQGLVKEFPELDVIDNDTNSEQVPDRFQGGLVYIKAPKVGGSTWGGIMRRTGKRHGLKHIGDTICQAASVCANHGAARNFFAKMPNATFITLIRDPVDRSLSSFFHFAVARGHQEPTDENKIKFLKKEKADYQMKYISKDHSQTPAKVMESYAFIGLTERFDESLLLLQKQFGLDRGDLFYLKAKESGHQATDGADGKQIMPAHPPFAQESAAVQEAASHLQRGEDAELKQLVNAALDKAIGKYGPTFKQDLKEFQTKLRQLEAACRPHFSESCLWNDNGCAQNCIDHLL